MKKKSSTPATTMKTFYPKVKEFVTGQNDEGRDQFAHRTSDGTVMEILPTIFHNLAAVPAQKREIYTACCEILAVSTEHACVGARRPTIIENKKRAAANEVADLKFTEEY